ncbi:RHS repeat-associated core domain-containing protein [Yoonia sp. 2307UL14-13]|uniref:RHS repeat-associated core domain-containing protein n=1 Tax=Yoonia sp. 2307UL14-13 TaxID=3126506 RepID=UPI0030A58941
MAQMRAAPLLLAFIAFSTSLAHAHGDHSDGSEYFTWAGAGVPGDPNHSSGHRHSSTAAGICERIRAYYDELGGFAGSNYTVDESYEEEKRNSYGEVKEVRAVCKFSFDDITGETSRRTHTSYLYCNYLDEDDELETSKYECPTPQLGACEAEAGNPIDIARGTKTQRESDWVSPFDGRFSFVRNYTSDPHGLDRAVRGLGYGWSAPWTAAVRNYGSFGYYNVHNVFLGGSKMYRFDGGGQAIADNEVIYDRKVRREGNRALLYFPSGKQYLFVNHRGYSVLDEMRWPDGYSIRFGYDDEKKLSWMQDNRGQRAEFDWLEGPISTTGLVAGGMGVSYNGGGGWIRRDDQVQAPLPNVISRIDIDLDYNGNTLQPDVRIDYDYEQSIAGYVYTQNAFKRIRATTAARVTEVETGRILSDRRYEYHEANPGFLSRISDGRRDANGDRFDYATFDLEVQYIDLRDRTAPPTNLLPPDGSITGGAAAPTHKPVWRATTTSHTGGADHTEVGFPVQTDRGYDVTVTNPLGKETVYSFERHAGRDRLFAVHGVSTVNCLPSDTTATFDSDGRVVERIARNGSRHMTTWDSRGRVISRTENADGPNPRTTTYTRSRWNSVRLPQSRATAELREDFTYENNYLLDGVSRTDVLPGSPDNGKTRTWVYNYTTLPSGLKVLTSVDGPGLASEGVDDVTIYTYNSRGQLLTTTDANGLTQEVLAYGPSGQPSLIRDHRGFEWALTYDLAGRLLTSTFEPGTLDETTTYTYDITGQMTSSTDALGRTTQYTYDGARRLTRITQPSGDTVNFTHDAMGNVTRTTYSDPAAVTTYIQETSYDALGRILQAIGSNGQVTSFTHDVEDNLATTTDAAGLTTTNSYDALNRMVQIVDRDNGTTAMAHDTDNQMTSYTDPRGIETAFEYNGFGDLIRETSADRGTMTYTYNNRGLVTSMTDGNGIVTDYAYDDGGRLVSKTFPSDPSLDQTFTYHDNSAAPQDRGTLATVTDQTGQTSYTNDPTRGAFHEDLRQIDSALYSTRYTSDAMGQVTQMDYPSGSQVLFSYDADGDITDLQWRAFDPTTSTHDAAIPVVSGLTYAPMGPLTGLTYGDGGVLTATYDTSYRLTGLTDIRAGIALRDETYTWTNRDNLAGVTDNLDPAQDQAFTYSNREFLASADGAWGEFDWLYDSVGNRREQSTLAGGISVADTYSYWSDTNQLDRIDLATGNARQFLYDGAGNVISDKVGAREYGYTYDAANRMSSFAVNGVVFAAYEYNHLGQQVVNRQVQNGQTIHSIHDAAGQRIAEYLYNDTTATSTLIREYIWANNMVVGVVENGALYYVRTDHIGRPVFATDDMGAKVWTASYLPFGGVEASSGPNPDLRFPGQWFQSENGLHQNWMRDYDPPTGRYMQADPLGLVDGPAIYGYALQNPGRYVDPRGTLVIADGGGGRGHGGIPISPSWNSRSLWDMLWGRNKFSPSPAPPTSGPKPGSTTSPSPSPAPAPSSGSGRTGPGIPIPPIPPVPVDRDDDCEGCPPCTPYPAGTIAYRYDTGHTHYPAGDPHLNLHQVHQNPNNCRCFWRDGAKGYGEAVNPPPEPGWVQVFGAGRGRGSVLPPLSP